MIVGLIIIAVAIIIVINTVKFIEWFDLIWQVSAVASSVILIISSLIWVRWMANDT